MNGQTVEVAARMRIRTAARSKPWRSPWMVASVVLVLYGIWIAAYLLVGHDIRDFLQLGAAHLRQSNASSVIRYDPTYHYSAVDRLGYDGQYYYYIALDPANARYYTDDPIGSPSFSDFSAYRYTRILYPLLARALAWGQPAVIPYMMVLLNWLSIAAGTLAVALWLKRRGYTPWLALIYAFSFGLVVGFLGDLTEPLAFALVAFGVYAFDVGRRGWLVSAACFALAALTRETTIVFAAAYGAALLLDGAQRTTWRNSLRANWRRAAQFLVISIAPLALYKIVLFMWLGSLGMPRAARMGIIPFAGLFHYWPWGGVHIFEIEVGIFPALICLSVGLWALRKGMWSAPLAALLANIILFVMLPPTASYVNVYGFARLSLGVVLSALYCLPQFDALTKGRRHWLVASAALWVAFSPWQAVAMIVQR